MPLMQSPLAQSLFPVHAWPGNALQMVWPQTPDAQLSAPPAHFSPFASLHAPCPSQTFVPPHVPSVA